MIGQYIQGNKKSDSKLFSIIGVWATSKEVHASLGMPVTSQPGDLWYIYRKGNELAGVSQVRILKNKNVHLRYLYSDDVAIQKELIEAISNMAEARKFNNIYTYDREASGIWDKLGFKKLKQHRRGSFVKWEKALEVEHEKSSI